MRLRLRKLLQFRLGTLLMAVTIIAVWLGMLVNKANRQKRAIAAIDAAQGVIHFDYQFDVNGQRHPNAEPPGPKSLRRLLGDEYFRKVVTVDFSTDFSGRRKELGLSKIDDEGLRLFRSLPDVETLELGHNRAITDEGLAHLRNLNKLQTLYLYDCNITGAGLRRLDKLSNLGCIDLRGTPITRDGVVALATLKNLKIVALPDSVGDEDLPALCPLVGLSELRLDQTKVTDDGLICLEKMTRLRELHLPQSISDDGIKRIQSALPPFQHSGIRSLEFT